MPALLLIGIPIAVVVLFLGIMSLPDEGIKTQLMDEEKPAAALKKKTKSKKSR